MFLITYKLISKLHGFPKIRNKTGRIHWETGRTASVVVVNNLFDPVDIECKIRYI